MKLSILKPSDKVPDPGKDHDLLVSGEPPIVGEDEFKLGNEWITCMVGGGNCAYRRKKKEKGKK